MQNNLTIIAVSDIRINQTLEALFISSNYIKAFKTIIFSSKKINLKLKYKNIIHTRINPINSLKDYSNFIIYNLHKYIDTSHVLIVQWDGFVIKSKKWKNDFMNYDYIGAPFIPRGNDFNYCRDINGNFFSVGNGGFSIRSKRLLEAPNKFNLKDNFRYTKNHEDGFFCVLHRIFLESKGYTWAPLEIAQDFSIESPQNIQELIDLPFGFHGKKMFIIVSIFNFLRKTFLNNH